MNVRASRGVDRFGLGALAATGALAAHEVGYLVGDRSGGAESVSHAYLGVVGPLVVLAACVAAWIAAVRILRHDTGRRPSLTMLAGLQAALFLVMEVAERAADDSLASLVSAPVAVGFLLQPVVAYVALRLLRIGRTLIEAWRDRRPTVRHGVLAPVLAPIPVAVRRIELAHLRVRGPPV